MNIQIPERSLFSDAADLPPEDEVLPGIGPGEVGLIIAQGAVGKSLFALQIAIGIATGKPIGMGATGSIFPAMPAGPVALVFGEDLRRRVARRQAAMRSALMPEDIATVNGDHGVFVYPSTSVDTRIVTTSHGELIDGPWLDSLHAVAEGKRLVFLDSLSVLHDCQENDNGAMTHLLRTLSRRIAETTGCAVIVLHHGGKGDSSASGSRSRGASAIVYSGRWTLDMRVPDERSDDGLQWVHVQSTKANYLSDLPVCTWATRDPHSLLLHKESGEPGAVTPHGSASARGRYHGKPGVRANRAGGLSDAV